MNELRDLEKTIDTFFIILPYINNEKYRLLVENGIRELSEQYQARTGFYYTRRYEKNE